MVPKCNKMRSSVVKCTKASLIFPFPFPAAEFNNHLCYEY